jgi:NADH-quinone oxidoreductase subunit M
MIPFHICLPKAHVKAPTVGSIILVGILLKLGTYGLKKKSIPMFLKANYHKINFSVIIV